MPVAAKIKTAEMSTQQDNSRLRIAYLTQLDPLDKRSWSGGLYSMGKALQQHCGDVTFLGPLDFPALSLLSKIRAKLSLVLFKKRCAHSVSLAVAMHWGREVTQKLAGNKFDVIVAAGGGVEIAYLETSVPIVLVGDSTLAQLVDYYPWYTHLSRRSICEIGAIEQQVFKKVRAAIMSSDWAAHSAIQDYSVDPEHVYRVSFGANVATVPTREIADARKPSSICRLLFMGVEWERKGGNIAFETLLKLEKMGIEAELLVCGCVPPGGLTHPRMTVIPFLDKNDERQARELEMLYASTTFFILPTRADCTPFVFGEAAAFGLPVITSDTGGVADVVRDGENGYVLPFEARGETFATLIADLYRDEQRYLRLVQSSRAAYDERLNWDVWGCQVHDILLKECGRVSLTTPAASSQTRRTASK